MPQTRRKPRKTHERERMTFQTSGPSLTHQSPKDECDINRIMLRWQKTGLLEHSNNFQGQYGDFSSISGDYQEHMNAVIAAQEMFDTLPSTVRKQFDNDPGQFLDFVTNPENADEMVRLGLAEKPQMASDVIDDPTPPKKPKGSQKPASGGDNAAPEDQD